MPPRLPCSRRPPTTSPRSSPPSSSACNSRIRNSCWPRPAGWWAAPSFLISRWTSASAPSLLRQNLAPWPSRPLNPLLASLSASWRPQRKGSNVPEFEQELQLARTATGDDLSVLLYHPAPQVLAALLENIGSRKNLLKSYSVKRALLFHPRAPRLVALRLLRDIYLMDLVQFALSPASSVELKRLAEAQIVARLPQLPLGQKIALARRGPTHVAGALVAEGHPNVLPAALNNPFLTEAQVLKALAREKTSLRVVQAIASHRKWSQTYNVRLALVRNPSAPLATVLAYLPHL